MSNLRIIDFNYADDSTLTASSEAGILVVTNLLTDIKNEIWRSTSRSASITSILPVAKSVNAVVLPYTNLTNTATMRVRGYTNSTDIIDTDTPVFDTTATLCSPYTSASVFGWDNKVPSQPYFSYGGAVYAGLFFTGGTVQKLYIELNDSANSSAYLEVSRLIIGNYWSPTYNADYGLQLGYEDSSANSRNEGGDLMSDIKPRFKSLTFSLGNFSLSDREKIMKIYRNNGISKGIYISVFPEDSDKNKEQDYQIYGKFNSIQALGMPWFDRFSGSFSISEI